jgi:hypothetical protein
MFLFLSFCLYYLLDVTLHDKWWNCERYIIKRNIKAKNGAQTKFSNSYRLFLRSRQKLRRKIMTIADQDAIKMEYLSLTTGVLYNLHISEFLQA